MKRNQLNKGEPRRLTYVENKDGEIDGIGARIGWVTFSKSGRTVYHRGRTLEPVKGSGVRGNYRDAKTGEEYWVSGVKRQGSNVHYSESVRFAVDSDAEEEYRHLRAKR